MYLLASLLFHQNKLRCQPDQLLISELHNKWNKKYGILEKSHGYIQWLFPIHEPGMNWSSQVLQQQEKKIMQTEPEIRQRILKSYEMMLDFYGFELVNAENGTIQRSPDKAHWQNQFRNLVSHGHNNLRISRILKFFGEMDMECFKVCSPPFFYLFFYFLFFIFAFFLLPFPMCMYFGRYFNSLKKEGLEMCGWVLPWFWDRSVRGISAMDLQRLDASRVPTGAFSLWDPASDLDRGRAAVANVNTFLRGVLDSNGAV